MENVLREIVSFYYLLLFIIGVKCIEFNSINGLWSFKISIYLCIWYPYYNNLYSVHGSIYQSDAVSVRYCWRSGPLVSTSSYLSIDTMHNITHNFYRFTFIMA
jgi:hypothetical protein